MAEEKYRYSTYTGKIHRGPSTITAEFYNSAQNETFQMDEQDVRRYIGASDGEAKAMYERALADIKSAQTPAT